MPAGKGFILGTEIVSEVCKEWALYTVVCRGEECQLRDTVLLEELGRKKIEICLDKRPKNLTLLPLG